MSEGKATNAITHSIPQIQISFERAVKTINRSEILDYLNLIAQIPSTVFQIQDYTFQASIDPNGAAKFGFLKGESDIAIDVIDDIHDEFAAIAESKLVEGIEWDDKTEILTVITPAAFYDLVVEFYNHLYDFNPEKADVILSTLESICNSYQGNEECIKELTQPEAQIAIVRALKSIISTYDDTDDFTVKATENKEIDTGKTIFDFEITLGKNSPMAFSKRFMQLRQIYDDFQAAESLAPFVDIEMWPCQTGFSVGMHDVKDIFHFLHFLFRECEVIEKAKERKARLFISPSELFANLNAPKEALKFKAFQH